MSAYRLGSLPLSSQEKKQRATKPIAYHISNGFYGFVYKLRKYKKSEKSLLFLLMLILWNALTAENYFEY